MAEEKKHDTKWTWFVWGSDKDQNNSGKCRKSPVPSVGVRSSHSKTLDNEFEVVQQETTTDSLTARSCGINDAYVDLEGTGADEHDHISSSQEAIEVNEVSDERLDDEQEANSIHEADDDVGDANDAVMISQTLLLQTRNKELSQERDQLLSERLQLRMETDCLRQSSEHIIAAQQQEISKLETSKHELTETVQLTQDQLNTAQGQIALLQSERDDLKAKLKALEYSSHRDNAMSKSEVLSANKHVIYGCTQCGQHLFDSSAMIQRNIAIDENTFGLLVDALFNPADATMGPAVCKNFVNGMYKVKEMFCDSCLGTFGWKICESFDEWNTFYSNKFCIDISNVKQISIVANATDE